MNEAIYRSPDWLKKFADFEIRTGKDIERAKDDKSKNTESKSKNTESKSKNTESKSKKSESNKDWDEKWSRTDKDLFKEFFKEVYPIEFKMTYHSWILNSDLEKIRNIYRGDFEIWNKFDKWLSERLSREQEKKKREQEKKRNQERIKKELDDLINNLISDFKKAPYQDKASTPTIDGETCFKYIFEDNSVLLLKGNKLSYKNTEYSIGLIYRNKFVSLANNLFKSSLWKANHRRPSNSQKKDTGSNSNNPKSNHPKWSLYQNLKQTVARREEQLKKMSKDDPDRQSLENEYKIAKQTLDKMKNQYQFEHLVNFQKFN